jgi:sodium transport system permease protein
MPSLRLRLDHVRLLYVHELRSALRERHIVVNSILVPIVLFPLSLWAVFSGMAFVQGRTDEMPSRVALEGPAGDHPLLRSLLVGDPHLTLVEAAAPGPALADGSLDALLELRPPAGETPSPASYRARIVFDGSKGRSVVAHGRLAAILERYRAQQIEARLIERGVDRAVLRPYRVEMVNTASPQELGRLFLKLWVPLMVVMMVALGTLYPAVDAVAGERERSTWETLATLPTDRLNVVLAKYLYVVTLSASAGLLNLGAVVLSMGSVLAPILRSRSADFSFALPLAALPVIVAGVILLALFVSAGMMIPAAFARTFKEGQALAVPFLLAIFIPAQVFNVPGIDFTPATALVPVGNVVLMLRDAVSDRYPWPQIAITLGVECVCIALALALAARILRQEELVSGAYQGRFGAFLRERVLREGRR